MGSHPVIRARQGLPAKGYPAGDAPNGVAAGDLDGDGDTDLSATNSAIDKVSVLIRRADGTFIAPRKYVVGDGPGQVVVRDLNGDGDQDLAIANAGDDTVSVLPNRGDGTFGAQRKFAAGPNGPSDIEVDDLDGDGDSDLVVSLQPTRAGDGGLADLHPLLVPPTAQGGSRAPCAVGDPPVRAAELQNLNKLLENHPVGDTVAVAAKRMIHVAFRQKNGEMFPDRIDDVWWHRGHGDAPSHRRASRTPRMMEHPMPICLSQRSLVAQALSPALSPRGEQPRL